MKNYLLLFFLAFVFSNLAQQICTPDLSQTQTGIYPDTLPDGFVGQAYSTDVTFRLPLDTLGYDFTNFHILSVSLPVGLSWQCNNVASNCDYNPQVNQNGCVNVYGTPLLPGMYPVEITVIADLTIIQGYPFTFQIYMEVLPSNATISNNGFTMTGPTGCFPITVGFTNNNPGLLAYQWNFGNGNSSTSQNPVPQVYTTPGDYIVNYTAWGNLDTTHIYTLSNVTINNMNNYGEGFPSYENADAYFKIKQNGSVIFQSTVIGDQNPPVSWNTNINFTQGNSYVIEIWDADDSYGEILFSGDDYMGAHTMSFNGCNGCGAGTSNINYTINHQIIYPSPVVLAADTIHVYGYPQNPIISYDEISNTISTPNLPYGYQWYVNGSPISGANDTSHLVSLSGVYSVIAINPSGCVSFSDTMTVVFCAPLTAPLISNSTNGNLIVTNVPVGFSIAWTLNGVVIAGATSQTYSPTSNGVYSVIITDIYNCSINSDDFNLAVGINELSNSDWKIFPNPGNQQIEISVKSNLIGAQCEIMDLSGRQLDSFTLIESTIQINTDNLPSGSYFINLKMEGLSTSKKLIILH
jgi:hypothetical protein